MVCVRICRLCLFIYLFLWYVSAYVGSVYFFVRLVVCVRVCRLCVFLYLSFWYVGSVYLFVCPCGMCRGMYALCISLSVLVVCVGVCRICVFLCLSCGMCQGM